MKSVFKILFSLLVITLVMAQENNVAAQHLDAKYEAMFIYNFTKYIEWKENDSESFVISVLGKGDIFDELVEMAKTKKISGKKIVIASYVNAVDITSSDMVFITYKSSNQLSAILDRMKGAPTIVITERPGLGEKGAGINFLNRGGKLTYELNKTMIKKSGMNTFGILNQLAIVTF